MTNSSNDILHAIIKSMADKDKFVKEVIPKSLDINIAIRGKNWDGYVDTRIANFVMLAQQDFCNWKNFYTKSHKKFNSPFYYPNDIRFAIRVKTGSSLIEIDWNQILKLLSGVSSNFLLGCLTTTIFLYFGVVCYKKFLETQKEILNKREDEKTKRVLARQNRIIESSLRNSKNATYVLIKNLDDHDTIKLPWSDSYLSKVEALEKITFNNNKVPTKPITIDGSYPVAKVDRERDIIEIRILGRKLSASVAHLPQKDKVLLWAIISEIEDGKRENKVSFQINAITTGQRIEKAEIVGLGDPRPSTQL